MQTCSLLSFTEYYLLVYSNTVSLFLCMLPQCVSDLVMIVILR